MARYTSPKYPDFTDWKVGDVCWSMRYIHKDGKYVPQSFEVIAISPKGRHIVRAKDGEFETLTWQKMYASRKECWHSTALEDLRTARALFKVAEHGLVQARRYLVSMTTNLSEAEAKAERLTGKKPRKTKKTVTP